MAKRLPRRQTTVTTRTSAFHTNCPKVTVRGAPGPRMTVKQNTEWLVVECPVCGSVTSIHTLYGTV